MDARWGGKGFLKTDDRWEVFQLNIDQVHGIARCFASLCNH